MPVYKCDSGKWKIGNKGDCKYSSKQKAENAFKHWVETKESLDEYSYSDTVTMDHSFLMRIMELMREDQSISDVKLHEIADRIIEIGKTDVVTMDDYDQIAYDLDPEGAGYGSEYGSETYEDYLESPEDKEEQGRRELEELMKRSGLKK